MADAGVLKHLAPTGTLRIAVAIAPSPSAQFAIKDGDGFKGVAVTLGQALAKKLGVPATILPHNASGEIQNSAADDKWDVAFLPVDDERKKFVDFGNAYHLLQSTFLVVPGARIASVADANAKGVGIGGVLAAEDGGDLALAEVLRAQSVQRGQAPFQRGGIETGQSRIRFQRPQCLPVRDIARQHALRSRRGERPQRAVQFTLDFGPHGIRRFLAHGAEVVIEQLDQPGVGDDAVVLRHVHGAVRPRAPQRRRERRRGRRHGHGLRGRREGRGPSGQHRQPQRTRRTQRDDEGRVAVHSPISRRRFACWRYSVTGLVSNRFTRPATWFTSSRWFMP